MLGPVRRLVVLTLRGVLPLIALAPAGCDHFVAGGPDASLMDGGSIDNSSGGGPPMSMEGGAGGVSPDAAQCEPGTPRCTESVLQVCSEDAVFKARELCASAELCEEEGCAPPICDSKELACDQGTLSQCHESLTDWEPLLQCPSADQCDPSRGTCEACVPGTFTCNRRELLTCTEESSWQIVEVCDSHALCNYEAGRCDETACAEGATRCDGTRFQQCADSLDRWETIESCVSAGLCVPRLGCLPVVCEIGEHICDGNRLLACRADQGGYEPLDTCQGPAYCNASAGVCTETPCEPGEQQCSGKSLQQCNDTRDAWTELELCATSSLCVSGGSGEFHCTAPLCDRDEYSCDGAQLRRCAQGRNAWLDVEECETEALCSASADQGLGGCKPPVCAKGQHRCSPDGSVLESCKDGRTGYQIEAQCEIGQCDAARGVCAPCIVGEYACNGSRLQRCDEGDGWVFVRQCLADALCDAEGAGCREAECEVGTFQCDEQTLSRCNPTTLLWETVRTCDDGTVCDKLSGQCDLCEPGTSFCEGDVRQVCNAEGRGYIAQQCAAGRCTTDGCLVCEPGSFSCSGSLQLEQCSADGKGVEQRADCSGVGTCQASQARCCGPNTPLGCNYDNRGVRFCGGDGVSAIVQACNGEQGDTCVNGSCASCDPGTGVTQCNSAGTNVQECVNGQFRDAQRCDFGCISRPAEGRGFCAPDCRPWNATRCVANNESVQVCGDNGTWAFSAPCEFGCLPALGNCAPTCRPGTKRCAQGQPQSCDATGRWVNAGPACAAECFGGDCVECLTGSDCSSPSKAACSAAHACVACTKDADCGNLPGLPRCADGLCVACTTDNDCGQGVCDTQTRACVECLANSDCASPSKPVCGGDGQCQPCGGGGDCDAPRVCDTRIGSGTRGQCLGCLSDDDCINSAQPRCGSNGSCFECLSKADCGPGELCSGSGRCVQCVADADCKTATASVCTNNNCEPCTNNADCAHLDGLAVCAQGTCVGCLTAADCNDGDACNGIEVCSSGNCMPGTPLECADSPCTRASCSGGECLYVPITGPSCDDDTNMCNGGGTCESGECTPTAALDCQSTDACQIGSCDPSAGCLVEDAPDGTACDDGNPCNGSDVCAMGVCISGAATCNDGNPCTADSCGAAGCLHTAVANGTSCDDGNACTTGTQCTAGVCSGGTSNCDDGNPCTTDACGAMGGCTHNPVTNGTSCDDGNACTTGTQCTAGVCSGGTPACDDGNPCTTDACAAGTGACTNTPAADRCNLDVVQECTTAGWATKTDCGATGEVCYSAACCAPSGPNDCAPEDCDLSGLDDGCGGTYDCPACLN